MRGMDNFFWHITELKRWAFENKKKSYSSHSGSSTWLWRSENEPFSHLEKLNVEKL